MDSKYLDLIIKDLAGDISPEEKAELWKWLPANREVYNEIKLIWDNSEEKAPHFPAEKRWEELKSRIQASEKFKIFQWNSFGKLAVAATVSILIVVSVFLFRNTGDIDQSVSDAFVAGEKIEIFYLPDSSIVWLNKNSKLIVDENFGQSERNVSLEGEAFFQVKPNSQKPFFVYSGNTTTRVVGTSFNIEAYEGRDVKITVESGAVEFYNTEHKIARLFLYASDKAICRANGGMELISGKENEKDWKNNKNQIAKNKLAISELSNPGGYLFNEFIWKDNLVSQAVIEGKIYNSAIFTSYENVRLKAIYYTDDKERMEVEFFDLSGNISPGDSVQYKFKLKNWFREANQVEIEVERAKAKK